MFHFFNNMKFFFLVFFSFISSVAVNAYTPPINEVVSIYRDLNASQTLVISTGSVYISSIDLYNINAVPGAVAVMSWSLELYRSVVPSGGNLAITDLYLSSNASIRNLSSQVLSLKITGYETSTQSYVNASVPFVSTGSVVGAQAVYLTRDPTGNSPSYLSGSTINNEYIPSQLADIRMYLIAYFTIFLIFVFYLLGKSWLSSRNKI